MANGTSFCVKKCHQLIIFLWKFRNLSKLSPFSVKYHILRVLFLLILVLTADWAPCRDGCEEDTEEEQQEGDQEDQGELLLQVGQPAGLAAIFNFIQPVGRDSSLIVLQDKDEALPTGWMKKRQFRSTLSEGVELMTGLDWYNVAPIFLWEKNVTNFSDYFSENSEICQNYRHSRWLNFQKIIRFHKIFTKSGSVLREWILKVREVKVKKILFHFLFEKWKVKWKSDSLISRMKSEMQMPWDRDREWKVKWKCIEIEIESEKWNENASRSRSRSEISREFSRNSWESGIFSYLPTVRFQMSLKIAYLSECKFALVAFIWVSPLYVFNLPSDYLFHYEY